MITTLRDREILTTLLGTVQYVIVILLFNPIYLVTVTLLDVPHGLLTNLIYGRLEDAALLEYGEP